MSAAEQDFPSAPDGSPSVDPAPGVAPGIALSYGLIAFLVGLVRSWTIPLIGMMPVGELLLAFVLGTAVVWIAITRRLPAPLPAPRVLAFLVACQGISFASYIIADLWMGSSPVDMLRGWLRMVFILIDIGGLALLFGAGGRSFFLMMLGAGFSGFQALIIPPLFNEYWKFGFGYPLTILVILIVPRYFGFWASILACFGLGALHVVMDFRSMAAICLGLAMLNLLFVLPINLRKLLVSVVAVVGVVTSPWTAPKMFADTEGRANRSNVERAAMLQAAWEAFQQSPFIGHGSWFSNSNVMDNFLLIRAQKAVDAGGGMGFDNDDFEGVAIHSQILVTLAEGGLLGGTFFVGYAILILVGFWICFVESPWSWLSPIRVFILFTSFWDVWMSAFTGPIRMNIAMTAVLILVIWDERRTMRAARQMRAESGHDVSSWTSAAPDTAGPRGFA